MILRTLLATTLLATTLAAQDSPPSRDQEQKLLQDSVSQVGNSPIEFIRAAERHLRRFPSSTLRPDIERAILKAAIDSSDHPRIISYGEKSLNREEDAALLDRVARALLASDDPASARRALSYAERLEKSVGSARTGARQEIDRARARALALQARAWGNLGDFDKAIAIAHKSFETYPTGEGAREAGRWELKAGRLRAALDHYADAFAIPDLQVTAANRAHHRALLADLHKKVHGSEAGLGDLLLRAYDRTARLLQARDEQARAETPNHGLQDVFEFHLPGLRGDSLPLAGLRGKVLVLDFWATWCAPCRFQHPLLEEVRAKYKSSSDVAFVSINADENRSVVKPFVQQLHWSDEIYFDDGLAPFYRITNIPTTIILNKRGEMVARIAGFNPDRYTETLSERIEQARNE